MLESHRCECFLKRTWGRANVRLRIAAALLSLQLVPGVRAQDTPPVEPVPAESAPRPSGESVLLAIQQTTAEAIARAEKSVVAIARVRRDELASRREREPIIPRVPLVLFGRETDPSDPGFIPQEFGTGVIVDGAGFVLTAFHVVGDPQTSDYYVWVAGKPHAGKVLAGDPWLDLAMIQIDASGLSPIALGDSQQVRRGQFVISLGNPFAIAREGQVSASWGIVSNLNRALPPAADREPGIDAKDTLHHFGTLIQTDARLNFGTSGGALINLQGEMIGMTTSWTALLGQESAAGFAIPVNEDFKRALEHLKAGRVPAYGFLGVAPLTLTADERRQGRTGVRVANVVAATPAAQSGIRVDDVITHVNGELVADSDALIRLVGGKQVGMSVEVTFDRRPADGRGTGQRVKTQKVSVVLAKKYISSSRAAWSTAPVPTWRGLTVEYPTAVPQFSQLDQLVDPRGCVGILQVERDSPAWKAGLRPGDFVSHVAGSRVASPDQFFAAVADKEGAVELRLTAAADGEPFRTVSP